MSRLLSLVSLFWLGVLLSTQLVGANATLRVNESTTRVLLEDQQTLVSLDVENSLGRRLKSHVSIEIIDQQDRLCARTQREEVINSGKQKLRIPVSIRSLKGASDADEFLWYRLRYRISPIEPDASFDTVAGVIAVSEITPDIFQFHAAAPAHARAGLTYRARVYAAHPLTSRPIRDVKVEAVLTFDGDANDDITLKQSSKTGTDGYTTLDFNLPLNIEADEGELKITARRGVLEETVETDVYLNYWVHAAVNTDKPLYQPGQTLHVRVLAFDPARRALANEDVTLKILDPESETVFRSTLKTSRFGVASVDWAIPENTRLGTYELETTFDNPRYRDSRSSSYVKISRYDLPNFNVNIKSDRAFYLSGNDAQVEIRAEYLFGQPVKRGHVRVVRETERHWNYGEQKWETEERDKYEGTTDDDGRFIAHVKLTEAHEKLASEDYSRFRDLSYAAYFTDLTTNRTEQRRFDLRVTKDAIHVYVFEGSASQTRNFPLQLYVSTFYADGTPAQCDVSLSEIKGGSIEKTLGTINTNRFGLAKVTNLILTEDPKHGSDALLKVVARDQKGNTGRHTEDVYYRSVPVIRVNTDKVFYRPGEPVEVKISASRPDMQVIVDVGNSAHIFHSELAQLRDGHVTLTLPYIREFKNDITIAAYATSEPNSSKYEFPYASRTILYPGNRDLRLEVNLSQESYRPGEDASINFLAQAANGATSEAAFGIVIFDKAVEERAKSDREFSGAYGFYNAYSYLRGSNNSIAGITRNDLDRMDLTKPVPAGLELVAELLLNENSAPPPHLLRSTDDISLAKAFSVLINERLQPVKVALDTEYNSRQIYPTNEKALRRLLSRSGLIFDELRDPWEMPYVASFFFEGAYDLLELQSSGPDKLVGSSDDFSVLQIRRPYFRFIGEAIDRAVAGYHARSGYCIRDVHTLKSELAREGLSLDALRDPWDQPYRVEFGVTQTRYSVIVSSAGPDKRSAPEYNGNGFNLWTSSIDYSSDIQAPLDKALSAYLITTSHLPRDLVELAAALKDSGFNPQALLDPWGRQFYATFKNESRNGDRVTVFSYGRFGKQLEEKTLITPVTQTISSISLRSSGPDGKEGTNDDFNVASFSGVTAEQGVEEAPKLPVTSIVFQGSTGAITGRVLDPNGAVVPGVAVRAIDALTKVKFETETDEFGVYTIKNVPAGIYEIRFSAPGLKDAVVTEVRVRSSNVTEVNVTLEVGTVAETVTVSSGAAPIETTSSSRAVNSSAEIAVPGKSQTSTPRLREYFPETLLWQPSLETDASGRAHLKFKLADNITTWKMSVIGSTKDGQLGTVEKEFRTFQPFFVDHDPPRVLTEGDEISLPVVVRNYLDQAQSVEVAIQPEYWFELRGPPQQNISVAAGDATRNTFDLRATGSVKEGKQRITARSQDAADAIEKPVTVHPDGQELTVTAGDIVGTDATLQFDISQQAIPNSFSAELKVYPNLMAHVMESVEAIMKRPYGCGEQTISSAYPSLLVLRHYKQTGQDFPLRERASRYLKAGYERLLNYRTEDGAFGYWTHSDPDIALTAYALRFLNDARLVINVDAEQINQTRTWLLKQQRSDGSWPAYSYGNRSEDEPRTAMLTAYVLRVLAMTERTSSNDKLKRAFDFLSRKITERAEPYLMASYALAAFDAGDVARAQPAIAKLRALSHTEGHTSYWTVETNTPFYGWGLAGRVETTALVVQALARSLSESATKQALTPPPILQPQKDDRPAAASPTNQTNDKLVRSGLLFLLRQKDRYGVWYSTQATINVLDSLLTFFAVDPQAPSSSASQTAETAELIVNGQSVQGLLLPRTQLASPILIDLSRYLKTGTNRVEIRRDKGTSAASAQVVATYYVPWSVAVAKEQSHRGLRLVTKFDKTEGNISDEITCHVEAGHSGSTGYGLMLAEIGLPPGADVDRNSLETAIKNSGWAISQYDVLPDRVLFYLWPNAGGVSFDFKFRPRFGLRAKSAPSGVYDYYNSEARAVVAPTAFFIR